MRNRIGMMRFGAVLAALAITASAVADMSTLTLSNHSSDETDAAVLNATFEFTWDSALDKLSLLVSNLTTNPFEFAITDLLFNSAVGATLAVDVFPDGWSLETSKSGDGMGTFDFKILADDSEQTDIPAGESLLFKFNSSDADPISATDFTSSLSTIPPGEFPAFGAAKFQRGPDDDSAFGGNVIPAPGAALLGVLGLSFTGWARRRIG